MLTLFSRRQRLDGQVDFLPGQRNTQESHSIFLEFCFVLFGSLRDVARAGVPGNSHQASRSIEMDGAAMRLTGNAPAMRDFHRHEERVAGFEAKALTANFSDEFTSQYV